jgi:hypothetical protein
VGDCVIERKPLDIYELLPAVYRVRDADEGLVLRALLTLIAKQANLVRSDIEGLWDDMFIETCADWVIPYIGDLVGSNALHDIDQGRRADVANTIRFRRRKGTLSMLEQLAANVTGWGSHTVDFRELLAWTQNVNHVRVLPAGDVCGADPNSLDAVGWVNVRDFDNVDLVDGPFETAARSVDVRPPSGFQGRYGLKTVGFFLWRLRPYEVSLGTPFQVGSRDLNRYTFNPVGATAPLVVHPVPEVGELARTSELNVPGPIRPATFYYRKGDIYGAGQSFAIYVGSNLVPRRFVLGRDLSNWTPPHPDEIAVDVSLGRIVFGSPPGADVTVAYWYGFPGDLGGGPYDRRRQGGTTGGDPDTVANPQSMKLLIEVPSAGVKTITDALSKWNQAGNPPAVIQVDDGLTRVEDLAVNLPSAGAGLVLQAANGTRPVLIGNVAVTAVPGARLRIDGLLICGAVQIDANLSSLTLSHTTLVPGIALAASGEPLFPSRPSVIVDPGNKSLELVISSSISGRLQLPFEMASVSVSDSILDSPPNEGVPVLLSGNLAPFPHLTSSAPAVGITIGGDGPHEAQLGAVPTTLTQAATMLQAAIRATGSNPELQSVRVLAAGNRILILPAASPVAITQFGTDPTASQLRLDPKSGHQGMGFVGGPLAPFPQLSEPKPSVSVTIGGEGPETALLVSIPKTVAQARDALQAAIRAAKPGSRAFTSVLVLSVDDQLVVVSADATADVHFGTTKGDVTTVEQLALAPSRPALATDSGGNMFGPPANFDRTTVIGTVWAKEIDMATDALFCDQVFVQRTQTGCFRFSYAAPGSITPQRYHCQPDLVVETATAAGADAVAALAATVPSFTSTRYGDPAYGQLSAACPAAIAAGSDDGSEMGAYSRLQNPQREANLRLRLREYLPFGLDPALIYVN